MDEIFRLVVWRLLREPPLFQPMVFSAPKVGTRLAIAYDEDTRFKTLARKFSLHPKTIVRTMVLTAAAYANSQLQWIRSMTCLCKAKPPLVVATTRKWDETKDSSLKLHASQIPGTETVKVSFTHYFYFKCFQMKQCPK